MIIRWTRESLERLAEIEAFISKDSPEKSIKFVNFLIDQAEPLKDHPKIGRIVPESGNENIREILAKNYRIIYRISKHTIDNLAVFEGHRLMQPEDLETK
jgi:toxin ParE1/3/4